MHTPKGQAKGSFQQTVLKQFLLNALLVAFLLLTVFFFVYYIAVNQTMRSKNDREAYDIAIRISTMYKDYAGHVTQMATEPALLNYQGDPKDASGLYWNMYSFLSTQRIKGNAYLVDGEGRSLLALESADITIGDALLGKIITRLQGKESVVADLVQLRKSDRRINLWVIGICVSRAQGDAYYFFTFEESDLLPLLDMQGIEMVTVTDRFDTVVFASTARTRDFRGKFAPERPNGMIRFNDMQYYIAAYDVGTPGLTVYAMKAQIVGIGELFQLLLALGAIGALMMLVAWRSSKQLARKVTRPVEQLVEAVEQLQEGNFDITVQLKTGDEFELLADHFNVMTRRIAQLMENNVELMRVQKTVEINQLKSQLNPHFLFNVLETLRYSIAIHSGNAQEIVLRLSELLRGMIYRKSEYATLREDMEQIMNFLYLHQIRFGERLEYTVDVPRELEDVMVPRLLLQPIIENSVKHGMNGSVLCIHIVCAQQGENLVMSVTDNGGGMTKERLAQIRARLNQTTDPTGGIGLYNIHRMLRLLYGEDYGITLENEEGVGLCVRVILPRIREEENHV